MGFETGKSVLVFVSVWSEALHLLITLIHGFLREGTQTVSVYVEHTLNHTHEHGREKTHGRTCEHRRYITGPTGLHSLFYRLVALLFKFERNEFFNLSNINTDQNINMRKHLSNTESCQLLKHSWPTSDFTLNFYES